MREGKFSATDVSSASFALQTFAAYRALLAASSGQFNSENGLGGLLFFAGSLGSCTRTQLVAANIAGAASLAIAEDAEEGKEALRDGVVDFLVSSLDEALRILKNELRKKQPTAVAVTGPSVEIIGEMIERGVQPDLLDAVVVGCEKFIALGARSLPDASAIPTQPIIVVRGSATLLARVDSFWREQFVESDCAMERWSRLSSRYLGRLAQGMKIYGSEPQVARDRLAELLELIQIESLDITAEIIF